MSRHIRIAVMGASGVLLLAATADQADAQRRAWRRARNYPVSYNACCPQPVYTHYSSFSTDACCPQGQFATTGYGLSHYGSPQYGSSQYHDSGTPSQLPTPAPQYAQPGRSGSTYDDQFADVPPDAPMGEGDYAESEAGRSSQIAQGQSGPQQRRAMRPNFEESPEFQRMQEEIDSLKQEVNELRQEIDQLQSRGPMPQAEPATPQEPGPGSGPAIPQGGQEPSGNNPPATP